MSFYYYSSGPKRVKGGIRLQSARGPVGSTWWGKRWVAALEQRADANRLSRGKSYARRGQVIAIEISPGLVMAEVQGSGFEPYEVSIAIPELSPEQWQRLEAALQANPLYLAQLLAGEMPEELETVMKQAKVNLFPEKAKELQIDCDCFDWGDPCKHGAAVYYLLAEQFDKDPFLLFRLRGRSREQLLAELAPAPKTHTTPKPKTQALSAEPQAFWQGGPLPPLREAHPPALPAPLLQRLKSPPFWRGESPFVETLTPVYLRAAENALAFLNGEALTAAPAPQPTAPRQPRKKLRGRR